jgi:hypothetical protein
LFRFVVKEEEEEEEEEEWGAMTWKGMIIKFSLKSLFILKRGRSTKKIDDHGSPYVNHISYILRR